MNKPLVERIEELQDFDFANCPTLCRMTMKEILADVRELIEAAQQFRCDFSPAIAKDETVSYCFTVGQYNRLSAILRKISGDIDTAPSLSSGDYFRCDECHEPAGNRQVCRSCVRLEIENEDAGEVSCWRVAGGTWVDGEPLPCDYKDAEQTDGQSNWPTPASHHRHSGALKNSAIRVQGL